MRSLFRSLSLSALAGASCMPLPPAAAGTIYWDKYAVPHIYAADVRGVVRGLGYATMENHAELLLRKIARARGRLAEYFGLGNGPVTTNNIASDTEVIRYGLRDVARDWVARGGGEQRALLAAYCAGVNDYAARHPADIDPVLRPILPIVPTDVTAVTAYVLYALFQSGQDFVPQLAAAFTAGGTPNEPPSRQAGSNAMVIAPSRATDGSAIIVANSHLPWGVNQPLTGSDAYFSAAQWIEAQLVVGDPHHPALNASGATFPGLPGFIEGFNDAAGWTQTANNIYNADLFRLTLNAAGTHYRYGNDWRPLLHKVVTLRVLRADHTVSSLAIDTYRSVHGPLIAFDKPHTHALALRNTGIEQPAVVAQFWRMIQARTLADFKQAVGALQLPIFNLFFADQGGEVYYLFNGRQPVRTCPYHLTFSGGVLLPPILDGTNPACLPTQTLSLAQLPQAANPPGGYVANGNEAPWYASFPQPASLQAQDYPPYITADGVDFRPQSLHARLNGIETFTPDQVLGIKNSTRLRLADQVLPDLLTIAQAAAKAGDKQAAEAAGILTRWDRTADEASAGGVLFEAWWDAVVQDVIAGKISADTSLAYSNNVHPRFRVAFDPAHPLTTPAGLDTGNKAALLADLDAAVTMLDRQFAAVGGAAVPWGTAHKTTLVARTGGQQQHVVPPFLVNDPSSGADDEFGGIRVVNPAFAAPLGEFVSYGGESYIHVIEFTPEGPKGGSLLVYGNASRPNSPHIGDQAALFRAKTLKPVLRAFGAVRQAAVRTETY